MSNDFTARYGALFDADRVRLATDLQVILPTIITWLRLEPQPYAADLAPGLEAQIADPLWMLTRQWQFAEFQGEDAGSPISVHLEGEQGSLSRYRPGALEFGQEKSLGAVDYRHLAMPLEVAVERETVRESHPRLAAEAGEHLLRLLKARGIGDGRTVLRAAGFGLEIEDAAFPAADARHVDPKGLTWQTLFAGRALDGRKMAAALRAVAGEDGTLPSLPEQWVFSDSEAARSACETWLRWYARHVSEPTPDLASAWVQPRQEYALTLSAQMSDRTVTLAAEEYTDGRLDWYSFDALAQPSLGDAAEPIPSEPLSFRPVLPTPVRYPGMPADRYWEFEDGRVSLGRLEAGPSDLARLLLAEYVLVFGNDWYMIPVELPIGSLFRIRQLTVRDTFGVTSPVGPARNLDGSRWTLFSLSNQPGGLEDLFFLAPSLPARLDGDPLEEVALFRDEMANMAWAVERIVQGASGEPRDRRMEPPAPAVHQRIPTDRISAEVIYRLATPVPEQWLPFVAVPDRPDAPPGEFAIHLERRVLLRTRPDGSQVEIHPRGLLMRSDLSRLVEDEPPLHLKEEEVPRAGAVVRRGFQYCRWLDGQRFLWCGRSKQVGRGEGASGLRYDIAPYRSKAGDVQ
ncbi:hypothetical protein [Methyloterricola oryzae]|uniref:hypothetical protein n=1 Tax=Methyloterricola oryzae TaxID=1495050 RepID=UPI0005EB6591|nr:hypothetical protein [Methyloterricola oryzae]